MRLFPEAVSVTSLATYWFCAEKSRLQALEGASTPHTESSLRGLDLHDWLGRRPRGRTWQHIWDRLKLLAEDGDDRLWLDDRGFAVLRKFEGTEVIGHPDDFDVDWAERKVRLIEHKTVQGGDDGWVRFLLPSAALQVRCYAWLLEPVLESIRFGIAEMQEIRLWDRRSGWPVTRVTLGSEQLATQPLLVPYKSEAVEQEIQSIFKVYRGEAELIPPNAQKCLHCQLKARCMITGRVQP